MRHEDDPDPLMRLGESHDPPPSREPKWPGLVICLMLCTTIIVVVWLLTR
jgi:hypothetical protein